MWPKWGENVGGVESLWGGGELSPQSQLGIALSLCFIGDCTSSTIYGGQAAGSVTYPGNGAQHCICEYIAHRNPEAIGTHCIILMTTCTLYPYRMHCSTSVITSFITIEEYTFIMVGQQRMRSLSAVSNTTLFNH